MITNYGFPVWHTQGGGLAQMLDGRFIFVEDPNVPGLNVGDEVPEDWDLQPANTGAHSEPVSNEDQLQAMLLEDLDFFFDTALGKAENGEIGYGDVLKLFPKQIREQS